MSSKISSTFCEWERRNVETLVESCKWMTWFLFLISLRKSRASDSLVPGVGVAWAQYNDRCYLSSRPSTIPAPFSSRPRPRSREDCRGARGGAAEALQLTVPGVLSVATQPDTHHTWSPVATWAEAHQHVLISSSRVCNKNEYLRISQNY